MGHHHEHDCCQHEHHHEHDCCSQGHEHEHEHHHHESLRGQLTRIIIAAALLATAFFIEKQTQLATWQLLLIYLIPYLYIGWETLKEAAEELAHGDAFNEHFLMSVATLGALAIGFMPGAETEFTEAVFVMLFFQVGELFEGYAEGKSRDSIAHLMNLRPDVAHVVEESGIANPRQQIANPRQQIANPRQQSQEVSDRTPEKVAVGTLTLVRPGEKIPIDGVIVEGSSSLNTAALTGESLPREVTVGDEVISGCVNLSGVLIIRTTKSFGESTVAKIIQLVESAGENKSKSETFISRFARVYTPIVVFAAIAIALLPPAIIILTTGTASLATVFTTWIYRALLFLIVSCPCALVISVPLTFFGGIGGASRKGILIKGANYMDTLAALDTVVFDKTGTLTHGQFVVEAVHPDLIDEHTLLHLAAHVEHFSTHPIGAALRDAFPNEATDGCTVSDIQEIAGQGVTARIKMSDEIAEMKTVAVGNTRLMDAVGALWRDCRHVGTIIHVAIDGQYAGHIVINDRIKDDSAAAIEQLRRLGVSRTVMLTGDRKAVGEDVARRLGITECHTELLPDEKVERVSDLARQNDGDHRTTLAFVGDGINDAPVLARADVGIAMGGLGSDAAIEAADVVLMDDRPSKIPMAIAIARRTIAIARQNVAFAIGVKVAVLVLAALGLATMWMAVFADVGVTIIAILNAMRALR